MIAIVQGRLLEQGQDHIIIDTGGIGYKVYVPVRTLAEFGPLGSEVCLRTHLSVREDSWTLFGFLSPEEVEMFHHVTSVSGIGPKLGLSILSAYTVSQIARGITGQDAKMFTSISGVGKKTVGRLLLELKEKVGAYAIDLTSLPGTGTKPAASQVSNGAEDEVRLALEALGFQGPEVVASVSKAIEELGAQAPVPKLLKKALVHFRKK